MSASGPEPDSSCPDSLTYLCLQPMRQGQASYAHVTEIVAGLSRLEWSVRLVTVPPDTPRRLAARVLAAGRALSTCLRSGRSSLLYVRTHPAALPVTAWARVRKQPVVQELNGSPDDVVAAWPQLRPLRPLIRRAFTWQLRRASAVITVTEGLRIWVETNAERTATVVPNGVDPDRFEPLVLPLSSEPHRYVVFFGALAPWQGIRTLLEATRCSCWPPDVSLIVAGEGTERPLVEAAAQARPDRVTYLGALGYDDVPSVVAHSLAVMIPKEYEHAHLGLSPLKLYEAMASGVPVVVTEVPGLRDTVQQERCGVVVPVGDANALARAVAFLASNPAAAQQMGVRGRAAAVARHTWAHRAAVTVDVLRSVAVSAKV